MRCSVCKKEGHKKNNPKFHPTYVIIHEPIADTKTKKSRGKQSFKSGNAYESKIHDIICRIFSKPVNNETYVVGKIAGAKAGSDIKITSSNRTIGIEIKNKGGFEGGVKKLEYGKNRLEIKEDSVHKEILGDICLYEGKNLPWYEGKKSVSAWNEVKSLFKKDIYLQASSDAISRYYKKIGTYYIQIEGYGLYHTGDDILQLGVPEFSCKICLRIRSTKHLKKGIPTDITAGLQYDKRTLPSSPFSLDGILPLNMKLVEE